MEVLIGQLQQLIEMGAVGALGGPLNSLQAPIEDADRDHADYYGAIQQASWNSSEMEHSSQLYSAVGIESNPSSQVVRDNAPSSYVVIACLVGFAILSLVLCLSSLPHYWFLGNSLTWRERDKW